jgi:uncharacterized protein (TIGR02646 family)
MKYIRKDHLKEPISLREFRETTPNAAYDGLHGDVKETLRLILLEEQGFLCAYCMGRISNDRNNMEIEHYVTQKRHLNSPFSEQEHKDQELRYLNMLGTCNGLRSCSGIRGNKPLVVDPKHPDCEQLVKFKKDGFAYSDDLNVTNDINHLELNKLTDVRREIIDKARERLKKHQNWSNNIIEKEINNWKSKKKTRYGLAYEPYCMAAVHYLESKKKN